MTYTPNQYVLTQHAFVEAERLKHVENIRRKYEQKRIELLETRKKKKK